jgi:hypothetical protein
LNIHRKRLCLKIHRGLSLSLQANSVALSRLSHDFPHKVLSNLASTSRPTNDVIWSGILEALLNKQRKRLIHSPDDTRFQSSVRHLAVTAVIVCVANRAKLSTLSGIHSVICTQHAQMSTGGESGLLRDHETSPNPHTLQVIRRVCREVCTDMRETGITLRKYDNVACFLRIPEIRGSNI